MLGTKPGEIAQSHLITFAFAVGAEAIPLEVDLPYFVLYNADTVSHTVTATGRASSDKSAPIPFAIGPGLMVPIPTLPFSLLKDAQANGNLYGFYSDVPIGGPRVGGGAPVATVKHNFAGAVITPSATGAFQMGGLGGSGQLRIVPQLSGNVMCIVSLRLNQGAASDGVQIKIAQATPASGSPALNAAATGTASRICLETTAAATGALSGIAIAVFLGLTLGANYWFDVQVQVGGATDTVAANEGELIELAS